MVASFSFFLTTLTSFRRARRSTPAAHPRRRSFARNIAADKEDLDIVPTGDTARIARAIADDYRRHRASRRFTR